MKMMKTILFTVISLTSYNSFAGQTSVDGNDGMAALALESAAELCDPTLISNFNATIKNEGLLSATFNSTTFETGMRSVTIKLKTLRHELIVQRLYNGLKRDQQYPAGCGLTTDGISGF